MSVVPPHSVLYVPGEHSRSVHGTHIPCCLKNPCLHVKLHASSVHTPMPTTGWQGAHCESYVLMHCMANVPGAQLRLVHSRHVSLARQ